MPTKRKRETVKELQELFSKSEVLIFTDYRGLTVADITNLRRQLREKGVEYHVTKNTLTTLAADRAGMSDMIALLDGPTAIAFVGQDIPGAAKVLGDFVRTSKILQIRGGLVGHTMINSDQVGDLTKILPREQYIAKLLGSMQSPLSGMMSVLTGVMRGFVTVLQARADQMKESGEGAEGASGVETPTLVASEEVVVEETPIAAMPDATEETPLASAEESPMASAEEMPTPIEDEAAASTAETPE